MQPDHTHSDPQRASSCRARPHGRWCWRSASRSMMAGMVTSIVVGILGLLLSIAGAVGWFFQVLPHEITKPSR